MNVNHSSPLRSGLPFKHTIQTETDRTCGCSRSARRARQGAAQASKMQVTLGQPRRTTTLVDRTPLLRYMTLLNGSNRPASIATHDPIGVLRNCCEATRSSGKLLEAAPAPFGAVPPIFDRAPTCAMEPDDELQSLSTCAASHPNAPHWQLRSSLRCT
eukprot:scaffold20056_cov33-Tisochrysis_lutea.AAC.4